MSGILLALAMAYNSGTKTHTAEKSEKQVKPKVALSWPIEIDLQRESNSDHYSLAKVSVSHYQQPRFRVKELSIENTKKYYHYSENGTKLVFQDPVSNFSIETGIGSYTNIRSMINLGMLPTKDAIRGVFRDPVTQVTERSVTGSLTLELKYLQSFQSMRIRASTQNSEVVLDNKVTKLKRKRMSVSQTKQATEEQIWTVLCLVYV